MPENIEKKPGNRDVFLKRSLSTVVLLAILSGVLIWGGLWGIRILICVVCFFASWEWCKMLRISGRPAQPWLSFAFGAVFPIIISIVCSSKDVFSSVLTMAFAPFAIALLTVISFTWEMRRSIVGSRALRSVATTVLSFLFPVWMFVACIPLLGITKVTTAPGGMPFGVMIVLWIFLYTKLVDIFAYISGVIMGGRVFKNKLIPHISPKKTWEGLIGSFIFSLLIGALMADVMGVFDPFTLKGLVLLLVLFVLAVIGDLAGSLIKRSLGIKDSGSMLPGIGGFFDLIDSPAFTMPAILYMDFTMKLWNEAGLFGGAW